MVMKNETPIEMVCREIGGQVELARRITEAGSPVSPQAVHKWVKKNRTPADKAVIIENLMDGKVCAEQLCPKFPWPNRRVRRAA